LADLENPTPEEIAEVETEFKRPILEQYEHESNPYFATARLWDDGILDPVQTRVALGLAFSAALNAEMGDGRYGTFRM
jgi:3-methylcrotonyl-CoA carboxylase beta subunit